MASELCIPRYLAQHKNLSTLSYYVYSKDRERREREKTYIFSLTSPHLSLILDRSMFSCSQTAR